MGYNDDDDDDDHGGNNCRRNCSGKDHIRSKFDDDNDNDDNDYNNVDDNKFDSADDDDDNNNNYGGNYRGENSTSFNDDDINSYYDDIGADDVDNDIWNVVDYDDRFVIVDRNSSYDIVCGFDEFGNETFDTKLWESVKVFQNALAISSVTLVSWRVTKP